MGGEWRRCHAGGDLAFPSNGPAWLTWPLGLSARIAPAPRNLFSLDARIRLDHQGRRATGTRNWQITDLADETRER